MRRIGFAVVLVEAMLLLPVAFACLLASQAFGQSCSIPTLTNPTVYNQIQQMSGDAGDGGPGGLALGWVSTQAQAGGNAAGAYWMVQFQKSPSVTGASAEIFASNPAGGSGTSANALFYKKVGSNDSVTAFVSDFYVHLDSDVAHVANALEYDMYQFYYDSTNQEVYELMMGTQCNLANNGEKWDVWYPPANNQNVCVPGNGWVHTSISCSSLLNSNNNPFWHHIQLYGTSNPNVTPREYTYECIAIDGTGTIPGNTTTSCQEPGYSHDLGVQWQLDVLNNTTLDENSLHEWFDDATFTVGGPPQ
jgi:hypothetical protein